VKSKINRLVETLSEGNRLSSSNTFERWLRSVGVLRKEAAQVNIDPDLSTSMALKVKDKIYARRKNS